MSFEVTRLVYGEFAFTSTTGLVTISGQSETPILLLKNPSGNNKRILVTHFIFGTDSSSTRSIFRVNSNATITANGNALILANTYIKQGPEVSSVETYSLPTASSNGQILNMVIGPADSQSRGVTRFYWIDPGNNILVTIENSNSNVKSFADIYWIEERI